MSPRVGRLLAGASRPAVALAGPRRFSCDEGDPGFEAWARLTAQGKRLRVFLNGQEQDAAITADEARGFVIVAKRGPDGEFVVRRDKIVRERRRGAVTFKIEP